MERYWDRRAQRAAFHYVDSRQARRNPDQPAFWEAGEEAVDNLLGELGLTLAGDEKVIEIGCGIGRLTRALAHRVQSVDAQDISAEMLKRAEQYNPNLSNVRWLHGDGTSLKPLPDGAYDACISFVVFQHLPDPELTYGYVREMGRVLRPGGWAAFQVSNDLPLHRRPTGLRLVKHVITQRNYHHPAWFGSAVEISRLTDAAAESGLEIERVENEGSLYCMVRARRKA
jgi:SAM-dependent methyltransferase